MQPDFVVAFCKGRVRDLLLDVAVLQGAGPDGDGLARRWLQLCGLGADGRSIFEPRREWHDAAGAAEDDLVQTLIGLAKDGREEDFKFLAASAGLDEGRVQELWRGTRARVSRTARAA